MSEESRFPQIGMDEKWADFPPGYESLRAASHLRAFASLGDVPIWSPARANDHLGCDIGRPKPFSRAMPNFAMKTTLLQISAVAVLALGGSLFAADPAPYPPNSTSPAATTGTSTGFQGKITALDKAAKTVTIEDKDGKTQTLHIGDSTRLSRDGTGSANWDDLKVGAQISGLQKPMGSMSHAETLSVSSSTAPEAAK